MAIRSETDKNVIKNFSRDQRRIYDEWREETAEKMTVAEYEKQMADLEHMMAALAGG